MNKCLGLLLLCSGITIYAQNPKSGFDANLEKANALYAGLSEPEKDYCDARAKLAALQHLRSEQNPALVPAEINFQEDFDAIDDKAAKAVMTLAIGPKAITDPKQWELMFKVGAIRISDPFRRQAAAVGQEPTWHLIQPQDERYQNFDDPNYFEMPLQQMTEQN